MTCKKKITEKGTRNLGAFFIFYPYLCIVKVFKAANNKLQAAVYKLYNTINKQIHYEGFKRNKNRKKSARGICR